MVIRFKKEEFSKAIRDKMFGEMLKQDRRIGLREFAKEIGISAPTLSRIERGNIPDIETYFSICFWMKRSTNQFYNSN